MTKRVRSHKAKKKPKEEDKAPQQPTQEGDVEKKIGFDFGGLPNLDFKKNLGCH